MRNAMIIIVGALVVCTAAIHALDNGPRWASPAAMALKRVGDVPSAPHQPGLFSNLDCTALTYRMVGEGTMRNGCFTPTAFGMLDTDSETAIFNGTDEGLPVASYVNHQILAPWPKALNLLAFSANANGGAYLNMYDDPLAVMRDQRGLLGQLTGKKLTEPPERTLTGVDGRPLVVHPQATAFSSNGSWMVVETVYGYFARINLASLDVVPFGPAFNSLGGSEPQDAQVSITDDGRYVAVENSLEPSFKVYDLADCRAGSCASHEYWPFTSSRISGLHTVRHLRFLNDGLLSFEVPPGGTTPSGVYELAPTASIDHLTDYIGLGDSYTSGEGAFDYLPGTDTPDNTCHLSARSYPLLLTADLFSAAGGHSVACSGAVIDDIGSTDSNYRGQVKHGEPILNVQSDQILADFLPGYVPQVTFVSRYQPRVVTVSIGGNDIGFGDILQKCVVPRLSRYLSDETCYNTYESRQEVVDLVNRTVPRWTALYRQLTAASPGATVYAIGYPSVVNDTGKCPLNVNLGKSELEFAEELIHYLDSAIQQAAGAAGVPYVDISRALAGHRLCEAAGNAVAVNGLTVGNDFGALGIGLLGRESYHPNALGHELIEQAILRQTNNLTSGLAAPVTDPTPTGQLLAAARTGRRVNTLVPDQITERQIRAGQSLNIHINGVRDGLQSNGSYEVRLNGPAGPVLGNLSSGPAGDISGPVTIPDAADPGIYTIDVVGPGPADNQLDITQVAYIPGINYPEYTVPTTATVATAPPLRATHKSSAATPSKRSKHVLGASSSRRRQSPKRRTGTPVRQPSTIPKIGRQSTHATVILAVCTMCFTIVMMRTFGVAIFSVVLFASLLVFAFSTSSNLAFTNRHQVEKWLNDSNLYGSFVESAIDQADQTAGTDQSGGISLSDAAVKQAAQSSFSSSVLQKDVQTFLNSNYAWLNGKTAKPAFSVDLSDAKQNFGDRVGQYVKAYLSGLPACSAAQAAKINSQTADPLTLECRPANLDPDKTGAQVTQQIADSDAFLSDPVITADNINPGSSMDGEPAPYYQRFSALPSVYQIAVKIPWIAGAVTLFSAAAIVIIASRRRKAVKVLTVIFALAGLIMVSTKLVSDRAFHIMEKHIFNASNVGELQKAMTVFFHHLENQLVKIDLWFGVGYLLVAVVLFTLLRKSRQKGLRVPQRLQTATPAATPTPAPAVAQPKPRPKPKTAPTLTPTPRRRPPKPPRLIQ